MQQPSQATKEVNFDLDASSFSSDDFRMFSFKVKRCPRARPHDWTQCPFAHPGEKAKRRDITRYRYSGSACPEFRRNGCCRRADACPFAHGVFECWLHPSRYRTQMCTDGNACKRRVCFFAHTEDELRKPEDDPVWLQQQIQTELAAEQQSQNQMQALSAVFSSLFTGSAGQQQSTQSQEMLKNIPASSIASMLGMPCQAAPQSTSQPEDMKTKLLQQLLQQQMATNNAVQTVQPQNHQQQQNALIMQLLTLIQQQQQPQQQQQLPQYQQQQQMGGLDTGLGGGNMQDLQLKLSEMQHLFGSQQLQQDQDDSSQKHPLPNANMHQAAHDAVMSLLGVGPGGVGPNAVPKQSEVIQTSSSAAVPASDAFDLQALLGALGVQAQSDGGNAYGARGTPTQSTALDAASLMAMALGGMAGGGAASESGSCAVTPEKMVDAFGGMGGNSAAGSSTNTPHYPPRPAHQGGGGSGEPSTVSSLMQRGSVPTGGNAGGLDLNALSALLMQQQQGVMPPQGQSPNLPPASFSPSPPPVGSSATSSVNDSLLSMLHQVQTRMEAPPAQLPSTNNLNRTSTPASFISTPKSQSIDSLTAAAAMPKNASQEFSNEGAMLPPQSAPSPNPPSPLLSSDGGATCSALPPIPAAGSLPPGAAHSDESRALLSLWADMAVSGGASQPGDSAASQQDAVMKNVKALLESLSLLKKSSGDQGGSDSCLDVSSLTGVDGDPCSSDVSSAVKKAMSRNDSFDMILSELPRSLSEIAVFQEAVAAANNTMMHRQSGNGRNGDMGSGAVGGGAIEAREGEASRE